MREEALKRNARRPWWRIRRKQAVVSGAIIVVLVLVVGLVAAAMQARIVRAADNTPNPSTPTSIGDFLDNPELKETLGHIAFFNDVRLEPGPSEQVMLARDKAGRSFLVAVSQAKAQISDGAVADVMGVITALPSAAKMRKDWKLSKEEAKARRADGVYIEASMVRAAK